MRGCTAEENDVAKTLVDNFMLENSVAVQGLPLTNLTVAYYYTEYGTVLAFLSRPNQNYCGEALLALNEVRAKFSDDPDHDDCGRQRGHLRPNLEGGQVTPPAEGCPQMVEPTATVGAAVTPAQDRANIRISLIPCQPLDSRLKSRYDWRVS